MEARTTDQENVRAQVTQGPRPSSEIQRRCPIPQGTSIPKLEDTSHMREQAEVHEVLAESSKMSMERFGTRTKTDQFRDDVEPDNDEVIWLTELDEIARMGSPALENNNVTYILNATVAKENDGVIDSIENSHADNDHDVAVNATVGKGKGKAIIDVPKMPELEVTRTDMPSIPKLKASALHHWRNVILFADPADENVTGHSHAVAALVALERYIFELELLEESMNETS